MVITDSVVAFAHDGAEKMLDVIPLEEIAHIQDCDGIDVVETDENAGRVLLEIEWKVCMYYTILKTYSSASISQNSNPLCHGVRMIFTGPRCRRTAFKDFELGGAHS